MYFCRYAETQTAPNGLRYRDWVCVYASDAKLEKCKLEGHVLDITTAHQALVPWHRQQDNSLTEYVVMRSSLPVEQRVLHDRVSRADSENVPRFTAFVRSVKARLLQDLKLLPVRDPSLEVIDRQNVTVYTDETAGQVLVVYSPVLLINQTTTASDILNPHEPRLEFVSFSLPSPP